MFIPKGGKINSVILEYTGIMNAIFISIAITIFLLGTFFTNRKNIQDIVIRNSLQKNYEEGSIQQGSSNNSSEVAGVVSEISITPTAFPTPTLKPFPTLVTITPQKPAYTVKNVIKDFIYPNSQVVSESGSEIKLTTYDNPKTVTDWYKSKIKEIDMSVTSFVSTNTNENILNKLSGAGFGREVNVEIKKGGSETISHISVNYTSK